MRKSSIRNKHKLNENVYNLILPQLGFMAEQKSLWFETLFDLIEKAFRRMLSKLFHKLAIVKIIIKVVGNFETV